MLVKTSAAPGVRYQVRIGHGLLARALDGLAERGSAALVVIDSNLPRDLIEPVLRTLDRMGVRWGIGLMTATEDNKTMATLERLLADAGRLRLERGDLVLALGGGIVCDVAGFTAAVYRRGVRSVLCPTTLLAMVDGAVGGKTATNLAVDGEDGKTRLVKNLIGVFHQPARVVCDLAALKSLPVRERRCGLAECIKHGLIGGAAGDARLLPWTLSHLAPIAALEPAAMVELVTRNVALKSRVVAGDERETSTAPGGGRMMLNMGHTFGHALETLPGLAWTDADGHTAVGPLKHGEAVALGLLCAVRCAAIMKLCQPLLADQIAAALKQAGLPTSLEGLPPAAAIIDRMLDDKKVANGKLRLVLPTTGNRCKVVAGPPLKPVVQSIDSIRVIEP